MADKTISVSLDFTANTSQAEASLKNLQTSLASISNLSNLTPEQPISKELLEASDAAIVLRTSLQNAFDVNTGKLDLSKFSTSLAGANTDVKKIGQSLMAIGPEGQAAFRDLTNAVLGSSTPLQQTNALVGKLWDSLKRTAGWQLSSTMIHGFMGAIQSAYGYAQDLNESLNNIRIVTGASTDEMAKFAEQANKAAKGLSTTTTEYTDAALIYYQQGIRDQEEIEGRVATTIKLANVSGQSAEEVSSQMTAIWNNFDDGSHSLEYYADVITALGAATASSSQEISQGLSKFAAVADTVGMSYEYATSALATIVATTRQSADTVGTGLRTLFSRLQGLKLGETLEDGVDLNKYSKALESVGVHALDASGELRNMDEILDDLGERWGDLSQAQKVALAQTVGGVRQYTNLVALMDNWDFMKENVGIAEGAEGTLQEQADVYAESWEAAQKKVRAAAESIYSDLLDDKFFIGLTNAFAGLLEHLDKFIDDIGGLGTLLPGLIVLMNKMFGPQIQENIAKVSYNIAGMFTKVKNAREAQDTAIKNQVITAYKDINMSNIQDKSSVEGQVLARSYERIAELQSELVTNGSTMTQQQKDIKNLEISRLESLMKINAEKGKSIDLARKEAVELAQQGMQGFSKNTKRIAGFKDNTKTWETDADKTMTMQQKIDSVSPTIAASLKTAMTEAQAIFGDSIVNMSMKVTKFHDLLRDALNISPETQEMAEKFVSVADSIGYIEQKLNNFQTKAKESDIPINIKMDKQAENVIKNIEKELDQLKGKLKDGGDAGKLAAGLTASLDKIKNKGEITEEEIQKLIKQIQELRTETNKELELKIDTTDLDEAERKVAEEQNQNREQAENRGYQAGAERANVEDQPEVPEIPAPDVSGYEQFAATLQNVANYAMQAQMAMSGFNTALDAVTDFINGDATFGEALMRFLGGIAAMAPIVITLVQSLGHSAAAAGAEAAVGGAAAGTGGVAAAGGITAIGAAINTALPWLAAIGLALGLIIALFKKFHKTQDEIDAEKLEIQKKATEDLGKAYEEAKNKAQELNDTISKFKDNEDALNKLTKGSQEFSKALAENRELAKELISTCNLDAMDWYYDDKGVFHLTASGEAKVEKAQKQNEEDTKKAAVAESLGKYQAQQMTNTHLLNEAGGNDRVGYGTASEDKNTWSEVYGQMRAVGEDNLKDLDAFNQLVNEAKATSLEGLQEYINSLTDSEKAANARAISYFEGLQKSGLNDSTKNYIATNGIQGDEWNTYKSVTQVSRENRQNMNTATSDFLANAAELNPEVARMMRSAQQYDVDITKNIGPAITKAIEDGQAKANNLTDTAAKQQYAERMGYSVSADGKLMNGDQEVDVDMDQIRAALAESFAAESPAFAASLESAIKEPLQTSMTNLFNEASTGTIVKKNGFDETSFNQAAGAVDDWTDPTEIQTFIDTLKLLGMSIPEEQLQAFIQKMQELTGATEDASSGVDSEKQKAYEDMQAAEANLTNVKSERREAEWVSPDAEVQAHVADNNSENLVAAAEQLQEAKQAYQEVLDQELNEEISALELDQEAIGETTDYLMENAEALDDVSDSLKDNKTAAQEVAKELARYGRAVEDVGKNYEDWKKVLKDKDLNKMPGVMKELSKSYGDLLDLDGSLLSDQFLQNSENLDLMNQAINGVDGAYEELLNRAQDDMLQLKVDPNSQAELYNELNTLSDNIRDSIKDVEVGAELNDEGFLQSLTDLVNAAGMTADEATEYLSSMGIDAEVVENKSELEGTDKTNSIRADIVDKGNITVPVVASDGSVDERQVPVQGVNYSLISDTADNKKEVGAPSLKVTSAKKSSGGGFKRSHGGGGGGGKGGGGGGGGGGSKKTKETPKADRGTRYHSVNRRQSNNSRRQTENNRKKDRAFGKAQVELAREDLEIQKKKIQLQEEYTKEISKNLKEDREEMKKQFADLKLPINFKFDEDGEISNYQEIIDALFEKEKALVNQYNSGGLDDEAFDEAKKKLDEAKEALGNYEETLEKQKDELQTLSEYMEELSDKALELTQIKFELNMSIIEDQLEWLDYSLTKLEDNAYEAAKAIALIGEQTQQYIKQSETAQNAINEILARHGVSSLNQLNGLSDAEIEKLGFSKDEIDALKEYRSNLYDANNALLEIRRTITDKVLETFDTFNEKIERSYDQFEHYSNILESFNDIVDLLGIKTDKKTRELLRTIQNTQLNNLKNQAVSAKAIYEGALADYELSRQRYEEAKQRYGDNSIEAQQMEEIMNEMADKRDESYENWLDAYAESLQKAREIYELEMEQLERDFEESLTGIYGVFDLFDAAYERTKELRDNYIPEYEKIYELNKLNRDIQKEIDNSNSLRDRKALRQLQEEINSKQAAGVQLSKYEVEEMRKKFELEQARMNLEEARNNKSEVRLTRDQNGNWGYVYTAAEDKIADAEQKYEDALYQYQKLSDDYINELDEKIKELANSTKEEINEILEAFNEGLINENQRDEQISQVMDGFYKKRDYLLQQFNAVTNNLSNSLNLMQEIFGQEGNLIDNFNETITGITSKTTDIKEFFKQNETSLNNYIQGIVVASNKLKETNKELAIQNQLNLNQITEEAKKLDELSSTTKTKTQSLVQDLSNNFKTVMDELQTWDQQYGVLIKDAIKQNDAFIISLNAMLKKLGSIASYEMKDLYDQIDLISGKASRGETITDEDWEKLAKLRNKYFVQASAETFDTGGYTGEWGPDGKLAVLHQKEYILDENLTNRFFNALNDISAYENSLVTTQDAITVLHDAIINIQSISNTIGLLAERMNTGGILDNWLNTSILSNINTNDQLEQNVHIDATFPNVQDHNEIEMAFDNLVNKASQYANRKDLSSMTFQDSYLNQF